MEDDPNHRHCVHNPYYPFSGVAKWTLAKFLAENLTQAQINQSFSSADQLLSWIDILPTTSTWQTVQLEVQGYPTTSPIQLIWCDGLETVRSIISNPGFCEQYCFRPHRNSTEQQHMEKQKIFSSQEAFRIQDQLPVGVSIVPIIAASDKTPMTQHTSGLEMHPLFITIGNIDSDIRMKATSHAWQCVAFIPTPKFETHPDYQTILQARLWHKCVDLVFANLKNATLHGDFMVDPFDVDPWNLDRFQKRTKPLLLLGVHLPFWHDYWLSNPAIFLVPEVLHTLHKLFFDHILAWCKEVMGKDELDFCFKSAHKHISMRQFSGGGAEHRATPPDFVAAVPQSPVYTDTTIASMQAALDEFHTRKNAIGKSGSFGDAIRNSGAIIQYTIDVSERLLIMHCKQSFLRTNKQAKDFSKQVVQILDRDHKMLVPDKEMRFEAPRPVQNHFTTTALHITIASDSKQLSLANLSQLTCLPDIEQAITSEVAACMSYFGSIDLRSNFQSSVIMPSQVIQVHPPSDLFPYGNCDVVNLKIVRMVFKLHLTPFMMQDLHFNFLLTPLLYVQHFKVCQTPDEDPSTRMWMVERCLVETEQGTIRLGEVIPLTRVSHAAELVAVYEEKANHAISSYTSQESYFRFYLNHYANKEVYNVLHGEVDEDYFFHPDLDTAPPEFVVS
ncbi:hypothetical protein HD554DRAFT_2204916 [Boletus coccyginus]|nr:hypothetical protein HD554DRAFT_2204916 [Boletus coccyginus]